MIDHQKILDDVRHAFRRRQGPGSSLRLKMQAIAAETGVSIDTVSRLLSGQARKLDLALVLKIIAYCEKLGDRSIRAECFAALSIAEGDRQTAEPAVEAIKAAINGMFQMPAVGLSPESSFWLDDRGRRVMAFPDHAQAARLALRLPLETDAVRYACVNLGWVRVGIHGIDFADHGASPEALYGAATHVLTMAVARVLVNGVSWSPQEAYERLLRQAEHERAADAAQAFQWTVRRQSIDTIEDAVLARFNREANASDNLFNLALSAEFRDRCAVFRIDGTTVRSVWVGDMLAVDRREAVGKDVRERRDRRYGFMVYDHVIEATSESGPVFRDLDICLNGAREHYRRVAVPERRRSASPDEPLFVATCVERIKQEGFK